ncbi:GH92 family glycosyl hydrolase [Flavobacterium johnsoniae]|uniref:Glycoside hydrolase family 92 n=1 Tax=Flavobacterium johnsoniae (strain ATCC 17061 / DSM 2064 / JCM 8514 / BCRC 14874 / CCUG 350202 / NBRC 14942 / NCIMB 11054 / UW101) TaxID=376686 RepID=A5FHD9_FLAJ1|nr:GH92 family glycosyl hydrolase [Flavobacterium johnsoniae]ABQ05385.1 Glycoside hydrolase family 92 [Flavobacterium johnsoniae UW101]OXE96874.1 sugar hydrolase [Flavobacterium johnsoniae UW101]WQG82811.1 GH92 family glycosyl hydrolase [Flavobacterium johnsoniae UW101]SHL58238.1 alpha-1,2-mannosidase, putative [Flavobacterium johnsoniae]
MNILLQSNFRFIIGVLLFSFTVNCNAQKKTDNKNLIQYVDPMIGTAKMGHTYPGATVPFGSVQLSPETDTIAYSLNGKYNGEVYKYCAGYQYEDKTIVGFSHTHFSGTGHSDLGDFLIMPTTGKLQLNPGVASKPLSGYRSAFSHSTEKAEPAYYSVLLEDHNIKAELTATTRVGMHQYTFPKSDDAHIILDLTSGIYNYDKKNVWTFVRVENDTLITGYRQTNGWARTRTVYFAMSFSKPIKSYGQAVQEKSVYRGFWGRFDQTKNFPEMAGQNLKLFFDFDTNEGEKIKIKMALSPVSSAGALENMKKETPNWDFEQVKKQSQEVWNKELNKIQVETIQKEDLVNFYTAMYHAFLGPTEYMDLDRNYKGLDMNVHKAEIFTNYTSYSLWDTYRALHPFFNIVQPKRNADMVSSMLAHSDQSVHKMLPIWSHYANENWCMIGYHSVSVVADAIVKGNVSFDAEKALQACVNTAKVPYYDGLEYYMKKGYVPEDKNGSSVSKTLEYAYDDWAIAQAAKKLGKTDVYNEFIERSKNYKNVYDEKTGFMRPKLNDGTFKKEFDPLDTHGQGFIEGNSWNYSLYVPQDPADMIKMMGGNEKFKIRLDSLFNMHLPDKYFENTEDITREGIIGNYVHGNEPSHHVVYLYNWTDSAWKSQDKIRMILKKMYRNGADGLGGNDDFGQMSAWYIFSSLGFYPVAPGSDEYALGSPLVKKGIFNLENGKIFEVETVNQSNKNVFVSKVLLNGKQLDKPFLKHADVINGGKITFYMSSKPNKKQYQN